MGEHQGHRLRVFVFQKLAQMLRVHVLQLCHIAAIALPNLLHLLQQLFSPRRAKGLRQEPQGVIGSTANHVLLRLQQSIELRQDLR